MKMYYLSEKNLLSAINALSSHMISFRAEHQKYVITAFVDITCPDCRNFVKHIAIYNALGITVRLLPYPLEGLNSAVARELEYIWTSKNSQFNLLNVMSGHRLKAIPQEQTTPLVNQSYGLAKDIGLKETPTIITSNGIIIPGYVSPEKLLQLLEGNVK